MPPFKAVAENVTVVPAQTGLAEGEIVTLTGRFGFTLIVTDPDKAGLPVAQVALDVSIQVIASLFVGIKEYVVPVAPLILVPFTFH